jgi:hypothetical protein
MSGERMRCAALFFALLAAGAQGQEAFSEPPLLADAISPEPPPSVETDPGSTDAWRIHFAAGGGLVGMLGVAPTLSSGDAGGFIAFGKPLYEGERHHRYQWVVDSEVLLGFAPGSGHVQLAMSPTVGTNFYLGPVFGLEWRAGTGLAATPGFFSDLGLGIVVNGAIALRLFGDDRRRLKFQLHEVAMLGFLGGTNFHLTLGGSVAFEMPLP